jgi:hypothetical protein
LKHSAKSSKEDISLLFFMCYTRPFRPVSLIASATLQIANFAVAFGCSRRRQFGIPVLYG